jgi:hypothetical protein
MVNIVVAAAYIHLMQLNFAKKIMNFSQVVCSWHCGSSFLSFSEVSIPGKIILAFKWHWPINSQVTRNARGRRVVIMLYIININANFVENKKQN